MRFMNKAVIISSVSALVLSGAFISNTSFAETAQKNLEVYYNNIKIKYNSKEVAADPTLQPFIVDGSTYIPVRMLAETVGKQVTWDQQTYTVNIADKAPTTTVDQTQVNQLKTQVETLTKQLADAKTQITQKDSKITSLQSQIDQLKYNLDNAGLDDFEDELNDEYGDYEDTDAKITLEGTEDDIEVKIEVDGDAWTDLSTSKQTSFLQKIVNSILDEYEDAEIEGSLISDSYLTFTADDGGDVEIDTVMADLEDQLNSDYDDYEGTDITIVLTGDLEEVTVKVFISEDDWDSLSSTEQNKLQQDILDDVQDEFDDADVEGYVYDSGDNSKLDSF